MVTLKAANGDTVTFKAGPEVKNLAQVKKGDVVTSKHIRALALELKKGGDGIRSSTEQVAKAGAKPGEKPAGAVADQIVIVANVMKVDAKTQSVTLRGPKDNMIDLHVPDKAKFDQIKVGDQVEATYTEAVIVEVSAPKK
jgi:Cu/Ag efflux protein CusF